MAGERVEVTSLAQKRIHSVTQSSSGEIGRADPFSPRGQSESTRVADQFLAYSFGHRELSIGDRHRMVAGHN